MKPLSFLLFFLLPACMFAQYNYVLSEPITPDAKLLHLGENTILIHPLDVNNQTHKWITLDSTLAATSTKKLITPGAEDIMAQAYLEGVNHIIRIDQFLIDGVLQVSVFVFDTNGNILKKKSLFQSAVKSNGVAAVPFHVSQSPDKKSISLSQALIVGRDSLNVASVVFNDQLNVISVNNYSFPYNPDLFDLYMPLINNNQNVIVPSAEKFKSYRISSIVNSYVLYSNGQAEKLESSFKYRKVKDLNFSFDGNILNFVALYSLPQDKGTVAGILVSGFDLNKKTSLPLSEYTFTDNLKTEIKKLFGNEGRKGNLLNYLSFLPPTTSSISYGYARLLPAAVHVPPTIKSSPPPIKGLQDIQLQNDNVQSLIGTQPAGYSRPMNAAEAATYAAVYGNNNVQPNNYNGWSPKEAPARSQGQKSSDKNLLFFDLKKESVIANHKFIKIKHPKDPNYKFFTYVSTPDGVGAVHYVVSPSGKAYLRSSVISANGTTLEKKVFEDKRKIILTHYPFVVSKDNMVTFYENMLTGEMGLVKIQL